MPDILRSIFNQVIASLPNGPEVTPYPHQITVVETLLSGQRVVLRAPSGAGKSMAAWLPWLVACAQQHDFPQQLLHILPGNAFHDDLTRQLQAFASPVFPEARIGVQTEADAFDPFFLSDAVVTSVDQVLSIALHQPLGLHPSLSNINGGVLLGSYLVSDEFPALSFPESFKLWLGLLRRYYPTAPCLFTSAVLPIPLLKRVADTLGACFVDASHVECGGRRRWIRLPAIGIEGILRQHERHTIIVCNTVRGSQTIYKAVQQAMAGDGRSIEVLLLHQSLLHRDRQKVEQRAASLFQETESSQAILVTTSGIKVGSDLSADLLISDPASPDKLLLRAGHCARHASQEGRVIIARVTPMASSDVYPAPAWEDLVDALSDGNAHNAADELAVLDSLWTNAADDDSPELLRSMPSDEVIDSLPDQVVGNAEKQHESLLSRVGACLHRVPETVKDPFALERFSLAIPSLERGWSQWQASGCQGEWFALVPNWPADGQQTPFWSLVSDPREFRAATRLVILNSEAVSYDPVLGLELSPGTSYQSERLPLQHTSWSPFDQHIQHYEEHAARTMEAFQRLFPWYRYVLRHLGKRWRIPSIDLEQWLRVCILWHDAGKLTADWQRAAAIWQNEVVRRPYTHGVLARIDFQAQRDRVFPCPPHAQASALGMSRALSLLANNNPALYQGAVLALGHHHGIYASEKTDLTPHPEAWTTLVDLVMRVLDSSQYRRLDRIGWTTSPKSLHDLLARLPEDPDTWMAYSLLVRAIRLSDREIALSEFLD